MAVSVPQTPGGTSNFAQWVEMDLSLANAAAVQRLTAASERDYVKLRRRRHRSLKLIAALEVWALVVVLVTQTHLY